MRFCSLLLFSSLLFLSCESSNPTLKHWEPYDESEELLANTDHPLARMQYKRIQSQHTDRNALFIPFKKELAAFSQAEHDALKPFILEQNIPTLQKHIEEGVLTYESLTLFYLYRIYHFEFQRETFLNAIISLNPDVLKQARLLDKEPKPELSHLVYGMPILLKDNIDAVPMATTAGAAAMAQNFPVADAFIVSQLKSRGALILGKVNLSEWAYYFCQGCPLGYSAMGGQTLNPYGRKQLETGGSSSGSGVAVAANYAVAAIGSETSGSILSPSGKNSVVGLKPTIGMFNRTGIVPISSTLDTPGPMTKNVIDNAILAQAMLGKDTKDAASYDLKKDDFNNEFISQGSLKGKKLGVLQSLLTDSIYAATIEKLKIAGAELVEINPQQPSFNGFITLLNIDMKHDLPKYLADNKIDAVSINGVNDVIIFNTKDSILRAPYGQQLFEGIVKDTTTLEQLEVVKANLKL